MDESTNIVTINKDENEKFISNWKVQFVKDIYTSSIYKCDDFTFRITFANPILYEEGDISVECNFWDFKYYEHDIQYDMFIFNKNDPENDFYSSSKRLECFKKDFSQNICFKKKNNKEQAKLIFAHLHESSNQEKTSDLDNYATFYFYFELQVVKKAKNIITWFIPTEEIGEYHIIPEPFHLQSSTSNCIFTLNDQGYYSFQFFFFDIKETKIESILVTLHNRDPAMDGTVSFSTIVPHNSETCETNLTSTFINSEELFDETKGWIFDGGLHITIILNAKYWKYPTRLFPKILVQRPKKKEKNDENSTPNQINEYKTSEKISVCDTVDFQCIKLNDESKLCKEINIFCKKSNVLIPSNGKYIICLNLSKSMFNKEGKEGIYTSPSFITELNDNEFQIVINLNDKKLLVKSKNTSLPFTYKLKYSNKENCEISSNNGQEIDLPFDSKTAFETNDWLFSRENDNCFVYDCYNVIFPETTYASYLKIYVEISYTENMDNGIDFQLIESNSSISLLTLNIPTDAIVFKENELEIPKLYFPKIIYKSPSDDYNSVIKPELIVNSRDSNSGDLLSFEIMINKEKSKYPIFLATSFMKHSHEISEDELYKQIQYKYITYEMRRISILIQFKKSLLDDYQFIESNNESYFKLKLMMVAGFYFPVQKVPRIDISKIQERKDNYSGNMQPKKRTSMIKNKIYRPKFTEEDLNKKIEVLTKEIESIGNNNKMKRSNDHPYVGLRNQGATCYMNSILQSLFHLPAFRKIVYEMPTTGTEDVVKSIPLNLQRLFFDLQFSDSALSTEDLTKSFGWGSVETFNQHDSQEFLRVLLENLMEKMKKANLPDEIPNLFKGKIRRYVKCINVSYESKHEEEFYDISIPIKNLPKLEDSFESYVKQQELNGKNQYKTEKDGLQDAVTGEEFLMFPPILFLHLARFEYNLVSGRQEKINDRFEFPPTIDLTKYLAEDAPGRANQNIYDLYGVIVHSGTSQGGHYYAFLKTYPENSTNPKGQWFQFNDSTVTKDTEEKVIRDNFGGYIERPNKHEIIERDDYIRLRESHFHDRDEFDDFDPRRRHFNRDDYDDFDHRRRHFNRDDYDDFDHRHRHFDRYHRNRPGNRYSERDINRIEQMFEQEKHKAREMTRKNIHDHDEIQRSKNSSQTPISHSAYILIYVRRDEAARVFQPIKDEDVPKHLIDYMMNKEKEKKMTEIQAVRNEFESQIKIMTLYIITEDIINYFCKRKITGWDEQDNLEKACRITNSLQMQVIDFDINMKCDELYTKIAQIYNLNRNEIRIWRCNVVDNFPLKIIPDSDKSNIGGIRHQNKGGKMTIMIQVRTEENSLHNKKVSTNENVVNDTTENANKETTENANKETTENANKETTENANKETTENANKETTENANKETTENANKETTENANKETTENANKETTENANKETTENANKETTENANKETTENANKETTENANKETTENANKETTENANKETEDDSVWPLDINNNLMLYIKFFFPALKKSPLKFIGSILLDLSEDNNKGSDRLYSRIIPLVNKMVGYPEDTKLDAFTERTQDVIKFDLERSISSIKNDNSFRNGSILIFQLPKETANLPIPSKYLNDNEQASVESENADNNDGIDNDSQKVPLFHLENAKITSSEGQSITNYISQNANCLRLEIRNINDFNKPVARIVTNGQITFNELHEFIRNKLLTSKKENQKQSEKEEIETTESKEEEKISINDFYTKNKKEEQKNKVNNKDETGKYVQPGEDGPLLFFKVKIFEKEGSNDQKPPLEVSSINTFKKETVNNVFNNKTFGRNRKYKLMKADVKENENELKSTSFFILGFYEFKAYYGNNKEMKKYNTQYSENAHEYNYEIKFKAPLKLCMVDIIHLNIEIYKALNQVGETLYPYKYSSKSIPDQFDIEGIRVILTNSSVVVDYYYDKLTYAPSNLMHLTYRVEKIPEDQKDVANEGLFMTVCYGYNEVLSMSGGKPIIMTKFYDSPFLFKVIKDEVFSESKKRLLNFIGNEDSMGTSFEELTFHLKLKSFDIPESQPLINDDDYLFKRMNESKDIIIMPLHPPESHPLIVNKSNENNNNKKSDDNNNHSRKPEQTRRANNSIKIYN